MEFIIALWSVIKLVYPIFIILLIPLIVRFLIIYVQYKNSTYKDASGNSYFKTAFNTGNYGEFLTYRILEKLPGKNKLLTNLYLPKNDGTTTEIDLIMVNQSGIFVFESKNYSGWIYGDEKSKMWTQTLRNGMKNRFFNPIWQNKAHITALKNVLTDVDDSLIHSYIIFSERCELRKVNVLSEEIKLIKRNQLLRTLKSHTNLIGERLNEETVERLNSLLIKYTHADETKKQQHIINISK